MYGHVYRWSTHVGVGGLMGVTPSVPAIPPCVSLLQIICADMDGPPPAGKVVDGGFTVVVLDGTVRSAVEGGVVALDPGAALVVALEGEAEVVVSEGRVVVVGRAEAPADRVVGVVGDVVVVDVVVDVVVVSDVLTRWLAELQPARRLTARTARRPAARAGRHGRVAVIGDQRSRARPLSVARS